QRPGPGGEAGGGGGGPRRRGGHGRRQGRFLPPNGRPPGRSRTDQLKSGRNSHQLIPVEGLLDSRFVSRVKTLRIVPSRKRNLLTQETDLHASNDRSARTSPRTYPDMSGATPRRRAASGLPVRAAA